MPVADERQAAVLWPAKILELAGDGIVCTDEHGRIVLFNRAAEQMFGHRAEQVLGRRVEVLMPGRFRRSHRQQVRAFAGGRGPDQRLMGERREVLGLRGDGVEFPVEIMLSRQALDGRPVLTAVVRDVGERRRTEEALRESEAKLREAQRVGRVGFWEFEPATGRMTWSPELFELLGRDPAQGEPTLEELRGLVDPAQLPEFDAQVERAMRDRAPYEAEWRVRRPDGAWRWVRSRAKPHVEQDGAVTRLLGVNIDVTEPKEHEEELRVSEQRYRMALVNSPVVLFNQDLDLRYTWLHNPKLDFQAENVLGRTDADLFEPEDAARLAAVKRRVIETGRPERKEVRASNAAGVEAWYDLYAEPLRDANGRIVGVACVAVDVTDHMRAQEGARLLLREQEHRLKNMLSTVQALVLQSLHASPSPEAFAEAIGGRLAALGNAQTLLTRGGWRGALLADLVREELAPYRPEDAGVVVSGEVVVLEPDSALALELALHELTTNAAKYGALSVPDGRVEVAWVVEEASEGPLLILEWTERGGPPVRAPARRGFGSHLIERGIAFQLGGDVQLEFPSQGVRCRIELPLGMERGPPGIAVPAAV